MVYVLSHTGQPLMPTMRYGRVRRMLRDGLAVAVRREPFTIRLTYETTDFTQPVTLGVDAGTTHVGLSATTKTKELFSAEMQLRTDIVKLLSSRREARRTRRSRKLRYRARCISGHPQAKLCAERLQMRQVANHTRSLHVQNMTKGGKRRSTIAPHCIGKTRLQRYDKVLWNGIRCFIAGSTGGRPVLRNINWALVTPTASVNSKTVTFLSRKRSGFILQIIKNSKLITCEI